MAPRINESVAATFPAGGVPLSTTAADFPEEKQAFLEGRAQRQLQQAQAQNGDDVNALVLEFGGESLRAGHSGEDLPRFECPFSMASAIGDDATMNDVPSGGSDARGRKHLMPVNTLRPMYGYEILPGWKTETFASLASLLSNFAPPASELGGSGGNTKRTITPPYEIVPEVAEVSLDVIGAQIGELGPNTPVIVIEPAMRDEAFRKVVSDLLFEKKSVPAVYFAREASCACSAMGKTSGLVIDIGAQKLSVCGVSEGFALLKSLRSHVIGGNMINQLLRTLLDEQGLYLTAPFAFKRNQFTQTLEKVDVSKVDTTYRMASTTEQLRLIKEAICLVAPDADAALLGPPPAAAQKDDRVYTLPDGALVNAAAINPYAPCEVLFRPFSSPRPRSPQALQQPELSENEAMKLYGYPPEAKISASYPGIGPLALESLISTDVDVHSQLLQSVIVCGGTSLLSGLSDRVALELMKPGAFGKSVRVKMTSPASHFERRYAPWIGGSVLGSLQSFQHLWVSKKEYEENGPDAVFRTRCL